MKIKISYWMSAFMLLSSVAFAQIQLAISEIINQVNIDSLSETVNVLSGEKQFFYNAGMVRIQSRHRDNPDNQLAAEYIKMRLRKYGLTVIGQDFMTSGQNVFAYQYGKEKPHYIVIICAHYDDMPSGNTAPGADDNASGTAAVIEAARILSNYSTKYSILYALWDQEEQGLQGSNYFASQAALQNKDSIFAVLNLDMIAYDSDNDFTAEIHTRDIAGSVEFAQTIKNINAEYNIGLNIEIINPGTNRSDHAPFWDRNLTGVLLIEDFTKDTNGKSDFNLFYHQTADRTDKFNNAYYKAAAKLSIASLVQKVGIYDPDSHPVPATFSLRQNYPNPFNFSTTIEYNLPVSSFVKLSIYDILGNELAVLINEYQEPDMYSVNFNTDKIQSGLSSGVYFYVLNAGNFVSTKKMILIK